MELQVEGDCEFVPFSNNCSNSRSLLTKLLACCGLAHPSLVQVYNLVPGVLRQLSVLAMMEDKVWLFEVVDRSPLYRYQVQTESINTGNEWRIVGQLAQSVAAKYFFAPLYVSSCQNQVFMLSSVKTSRRASRRSFPKANVARAAGVLQSKKEYYQSKAQSCFLA